LTAFVLASVSADGKPSGLGFNDCKMYFNGPPFGVVCPWLSVAGLVFTGILLCWNINGAFIMGGWCCAGVAGLWTGNAPAPL
jgi:hypothetical protein